MWRYTMRVHSFHWQPLSPPGMEAAALHHAAINGHVECVAALLRRGAEVNMLDSDEATPLHWAAESGEQACAAALLAAGGEPLAADAEGCTPLHCAAVQDHVHLLRVLLPANPKAALLQNSDLFTPLDVALTNGRHAAAQWLLEQAPLQPTGEILESLAAAEAGAAAEGGAEQRVHPLYACLAARAALTARQWACFPTPCTRLGAALPAVLARSAGEAALLMRHLTNVEQQRLRTLALCLHCAATRPPLRRRARLPLLPTPLVWHLLALSAADPPPERRRPRPFFYRCLPS